MKIIILSVLLILISTCLAIQPSAFAEVLSLQTDSTSYSSGSKIYVSGTTLSTDPPYVTVVIYNPNNEFVLILSGISDSSTHTFQIIVDTSTQENQHKFSLVGTYHATAFIANKTAGKTVNFDILPQTQSSSPSPQQTPTVLGGASISLDKQNYNITDSVIITAVIPACNKDPNIIEAVGIYNNINPALCGVVIIKTNKAELDYFPLYETGRNTGIFQGVVKLGNQYAFTNKNVGIESIAAYDYDTINVAYLQNLQMINATASIYPHQTSTPPQPINIPPVQTQNFHTITDIKMTLGSSAGQSCVATNNCFDPANTQVAPGDTVTWTNGDTASHTVTSGKPSDATTGTVFDSSLVKAGATFAFTFKDAGTFDYYCQVHPWMTGQVIVGSGGNKENKNENYNSGSIFHATQQDMENINNAKSSETIAAEVNVGDNQAQTTSIDNNVSVQTTINNPDSLESKVTAPDQTGPKVIMFNLAAKTINVENLKDLGIMYDGKPISPALNMDAILHAKSTDSPSFAIVVTQSGIQVLVLVPHFSTHTITITNMSKVTSTVPEFGGLASITLAIMVVLSIFILSTRNKLTCRKFE